MFKPYYDYQYAKLVFDIVIIIMVIISYLNFGSIKDFLNKRIERRIRLVAFVLTPFLGMAVIVSLYYLKIHWIIGVTLNALLYVAETLLFFSIYKTKKVN